MDTDMGSPHRRGAGERDWRGGVGDGSVGVGGAEELWVDCLARENVDTGTMMGFPCLRLSGRFFASCEPRTGALIVKLPAARVQELIAAGDALAFAPNGRTFREWALIPERDAQRWARLIDEALDFATP